jgi:hypothetical protein
MAEDGKRDSAQSGGGADDDSAYERLERGLSDRVKRAMAAGLEAASRSKDDLLRAAGTEIGAWLERVDVHSELVKALAKMVVEVKAEIRFRPREDGTLGAETTSEVKVKTGAKP